MNLQMGIVSPLHHAQFDDFFEIVKEDQDNSPTSTCTQLGRFKKTIGRKLNTPSRGRSIIQITETEDPLGTDLEVP